MSECEKSENPEESENIQPTEVEQPAKRHHVTTIRTVDRQVGEHVLAALNEDDAVAAITTLVTGVRNDRIVSMPLTRDQVEAIREVLEQAQAEANESEDEEEGRREGFLGFHTVLHTNPEEATSEDE
jgi:hypothetical protein